MDHADHVALIVAGVLDSGPRWLDLGAGTGAFTLALLELLRDDADVVAVDRDERALDALRASAAARFPGRNVTTRTGDFTTPLPVDDESFDGVLMAKLAALRSGQGTRAPPGRGNAPAARAIRARRVRRRHGKSVGAVSDLLRAMD